MPSSAEDRSLCLLLLLLLLCLTTCTNGLFDALKGSSFPDTFRKLAKSECILVIRFPPEPNQKDQATRDCSGHLIKLTPSGAKGKDAKPKDFILTSAHCFSRGQPDQAAAQQDSDGDDDGDQQQNSRRRRRRRKRQAGWFFGGRAAGEAGDSDFIGEIFAMCGVEEYTEKQQVRIESTAASPAVFLGDKYSGNTFDARDIALIPISPQCSQMISKHKTLKTWKFQPLKLGGRPPFEGTTKKGETTPLMCKVIGWLGQEGTKPAVTGQYDAQMVDPAKCTPEYKLDQNSPPICTMIAKSNKQPVTRCTIKDCSVCGTPLVTCQDKVGSKNFVPVAIGIMSKDGTQLDASTCFYYMADFFDRMAKFDPKDLTCEAYAVVIKRTSRR